MKKVLLAVVLVVFVYSPEASAQTTKKPASTKAVAKTTATQGMINADVIKMVKSGLSDDVVIASITTEARKDFDLSPNGLIGLKTSGVSDAILRTMQKVVDPTAGNAVEAVSKTSAVSFVPKAPAATAVDLPDGTEVKLKFAKTASSETAKVGDAVEFQVVADVVANGRTVVNKGSLAFGHITSTTKQLLTRGGRLELKIDSVNTLDGAKVALRGSKTAQGGRGIVRGNEAVIPAGTIFSASTQGEIAVGVSLTKATGTGGTNTVVPPRDVARPQEPGIYAVIKGKLEPLDKAAVTGGGVSGGSAALSGLTMGFKKAKAKADIRNAQAGVRVGARTEFYFYGADYNPSTYVLVKLEAGDNKRQIVIGSMGKMGTRNGIAEEDQKPFTSERLGSGLFRISLPSDIEPGEYAFIDLSNTQVPRIWEFGID